MKQRRDAHDRRQVVRNLRNPFVEVTKSGTELGRVGYPVRPAPPRLLQKHVHIRDNGVHERKKALDCAQTLGQVHRLGVLNERLQGRLEQ